VLDGVTMMLCLLLLMWLIALHGIYDSYVVVDRDIPVVQLLFPIGDLVVLTMALQTVVRAESRHRWELCLLTTAIAFTTLTHLGYAHLVANGRFQAGSLLDLGWAVALIVFAAAGQLSRRSPSRPRPAASLS
jgi:hypothetical protein